MGKGHAPFNRKQHPTADRVQLSKVFGKGLQMDFNYTDAMGTDLRKYVLVDTLCMDYITMVSSNLPVLQHAFSVLAKLPGDKITGNINRPERNPCYCDGMYLGKVPRQKANDRLMLQVPGIRSEYVAQNVEPAAGYTWCTRFDLQVTVPLMVGPDIEQLYRVLSSPEEYPWRQPGRVPSVTMMKNSEGGMTLYIGARTSDIMQRIYKKDVEGMPYTRYEIECKGRLARRLTDDGILQDKNMRATFARSVLAGLPGEVEQHTMGFAEAIGQGTGEVRRSGFECADDATLRWLRDTAVPALKRAMSGHLRKDVIRIMREHSVPLPEEVSNIAD